VIAEEITMTFGYAEARNQPVPINGAAGKWRRRKLIRPRRFARR